MRFSFKLQSLLNWKKNLEESSQMRLAEKIKQFMAQEEKIQQLMLQRVETDRELHEKLMSGIEVVEYLVYKQFAEESYEDLLRKEGKKKQVIKEIEKERELLIGLMKERKMLERLKEKRIKKFIYQMEKMDQRNMDEMVIRQYLSMSKGNLS